MRFECSGSGLYRRYWVALSPGGEAAGQGRSVEPDRAKMSRRTGARRFVRSGAVGNDWPPGWLSARPVAHFIRRHSHAAGDFGITSSARRAGAYIEQNRRVGTGKG